jgi:hypothetical protein
LIFFDCVERWAEVEPHLADAEYNRVLNSNFHRYTYGRYRKSFPDPARKFPSDWDGYRGTEPGRYRGPPGNYRRYCLDLACAFLVNSQLRLAQLVLPQHEWRIVSSRQNNTVWCAEEDLLFDLEGLALYADADLAFGFAFGLGKIYPPNTYRPVKYAEHFEVVAERQRLGLPHAICPWCGANRSPCCPEYNRYLVEEVAA